MAVLVGVGVGVAVLVGVGVGVAVCPIGVGVGVGVTRNGDVTPTNCQPVLFKPVPTFNQSS